MAERKKAAACLLLLEALDEDEIWKKGTKPGHGLGRRGSLGTFNLFHTAHVRFYHFEN